MTLAGGSSASALEGNYTIKSGDSLSKVAQDNATTWQDLHQKNSYIADPNLIYVGNALVISETAKPAEAVASVEPVVLPPVPTEPVVPVAPAPVCNEDTQWVRADNGQCKDKPSAQATFAQTVPAQAQRFTGFTSGNTYTAGQCTWHVKNLRPDLPNNLGNGNEWYYNASSMGLATGSTPQVGAAGVKKWGMHVVYVTAVNGDGTITVSEMNYNYVPFSQRTAIKNASDFNYIY